MKSFFKFGARLMMQLATPSCKIAKSLVFLVLLFFVGKLFQLGSAVSLLGLICVCVWGGGEPVTQLS